MADGIDEPLVRRLIAAQFPHWAGLDVRQVASAGTDNAMFRLGDDLVVRLPKAEWATGQIEREHRWLPRLSPSLPLATPTPVGTGVPGEDFGRPWGVYRWLDGADAWAAPVKDLAHAAEALGRFGVALRTVDVTGGPRSFRGGAVTEWEEGAFPSAAAALAAAGLLGERAALAAWDQVLALPAWDRPPVWLHGDLLPGNLLTRDGRLTAVIDFGGLGTGDPAADLLPAWTLLTPATRPLFRTASAVDDATWARGRGWALCWGIVTDHYYGDLGGPGTAPTPNPVLAAVARRAWTEALAEFG
ncbi:aminoglycoside phosphotransferase family protein [Streptomyces sp. R302]|uniref:aminoglycoside phosphotransferase family protein n=1 Tax=unclassified Streptomyces TaxID=2593676 RepID=UPI00145E5E2F|nr:MULTISPECIES: aminoglycoside phosphotransferase family protein [unclassified Streptomyces]NML50070.1 aminoglycoside phosphotransferase family protein [Streptomyces sp. R301]NML79061.1 aminoglycoside phosphotransferase family protein [Streptomyces sp. R302]